MEKKTKPILKILLILLIVLGVVLSFSSCHKDEHYDVKLSIVKHGFFAGGNLLIANGQYIEIDTCKINKAESSDGVYITSVEYYFDDENISTTKSLPYGLKYLVNNASVGIHTLKITANVGTDDGYNFSFPFEYTVNVVSEPPTVDISLFLGDDSEPIGSKEIKLSRNEPFTGHIVLNGSNIGASISKIEYYWDGELFGASKQRPYSFSYDISNEEAKDHVFLYRITFDSDYGEITYCNGWQFTVQ